MDDKNIIAELNEAPAEKLFRNVSNLQCRALSRGEMLFFDYYYHNLAPRNGQNLTHCIFYRKKSKIQQPVVNVKAYKKLNAFFDWISSLNKYDNIYVIANSDANGVNKIEFKSNDLVICFNKHPVVLITDDICDAVIVSRQRLDLEECFTEYREYDGKCHDLKRVIIMNDSNALNTHNDFFAGHDYIIYSDFIPYSLHPLRVPSTGYVILFLLNYIYENTEIMKRIHPVGFLFSESGWLGHDWALERALKKSMQFDWR